MSAVICSLSEEATAVAGGPGVGSVEPATSVDFAGCSLDLAFDGRRFFALSFLRRLFVILSPAQFR